jgi:hypothetical protein
MDFFDRWRMGWSLSAGWRSAGRVNTGEGRFAIGLRLAYSPALLRMDEFPYSIFHVQKFRLEPVPGSNQAAAVILNGQEFRQGDLMLFTEPITLAFRGHLSWSPGGAEVLELMEYRMTGIRMDLGSLAVPVRYYLNPDDKGPRRFFVEALFGLDKLYMEADYKAKLWSIFFDQQALMLHYNFEDMERDSPFEGSISRNVLFTHLGLGAGIEQGRFGFLVQRRAMLSRNLTGQGRGHERVRGNPLAIPVLMNAGGDGPTRQALDERGILYFGSTELDADGGEGRVQSSDRVPGVDRYWDPGQWLLSVSYRLF